MSILPHYRFARFRFYAPKGVSNVQIEGDSVAGCWDGTPVRFYGDKEKTLAERFANWSWEAAQIQKFTERYGPLVGGPSDGRTFRFTLDSWRSHQWELRKFWSEVQRGAVGNVEFLQGNVIEIRDRWLDFRCGHLWTFMELELMSRPERVRFCLRPECPHPYFVAQHGKERYCSPDCSNWAQSQHKKGWHEDQRRKQRVEKKK